MIHLLSSVLLRSAFPVSFFCPGDLLAFPGTLHYHIPFKFCNRKHEVTDQLPYWAIIHHTHVQYMNPYSTFNKTIYQFYSLRKTSGNPIQLCNHEGIALLQAFQQPI